MKTPQPHHLIWNQRLLFLFCILWSGLALSLSAKEKLLAPRREAPPLLAKRIDQWIADLSGQNAARREEAVKNLIRLGSLSSPYLLRTLSGNNRLAKRGALRVLAEIGGADCLQTLIQVLAKTSEEPIIRAEAARALGYIGDPVALERLAFFAFGNQEQVSLGCAYALCRMPYPENVPNLIRLLSHRHSSIPPKSLALLKQITGQDKIGMEPALWRKWWEENNKK